MNLKRTLGLLVLFTAVMFLGGQESVIGQDVKVRVDVKAVPHDAHAAHFDACAKACYDCSRECEKCANHCAMMVAEGKKEHMTTLGTCIDCSGYCILAGKIVSHRGPMSGKVCEDCAKACDICGAACEKFPDDKHMKECAKACRDCAKACREMLKHLDHK